MDLQSWPKVIMRLIFLQTKSKSRSSSVPAGHRRGTFQVPKPPPGKNKDVVCTILWKQLWFCTLLQLHVEFGRKLFMTNQQMLFSPLLSFVMSIPRASNSEKSQCCNLNFLLSTLFEMTIFLLMLISLQQLSFNLHLIYCPFL